MEKIEECLIKHGCRFTLNWLVYNDLEDCAKLLLDKKGLNYLDNDEPLTMGVHLETLKFLYKNNYNFNLITKSTKLTPLMFYIINNNIEAVKFLLETKQDIFVGNINNEKAIHYAAANGNIQIIELLIAAGADIDEQTIHGNTPLMFAAGPFVIDYLILNGANIHIKNNKNMGFLDYQPPEYLQHINYLIQKREELKINKDNKEKADKYDKLMESIKGTL